MNALLYRRYSPEELHGLSKAEFEEMRNLGFSRVEYDRHRLLIAYGNLCSSLNHLRHAQIFYQRDTPALALKLAVIGNSLSELIPSYVDYAASMRMPKGTR